jgi:threonyl-tRNA synthetase
VQVVAIPVSKEHTPYLESIIGRLRAQGVRAEIDDSDDRMQKKIRNAQTRKVPFMLIAGEQDASAGRVSFRYRDGTQDNGIAIDDAIERVLDAIRTRTQV